MNKELERLTTQNYYYDVFEFQIGKYEMFPGVMVNLTQADYNERTWLKLFEMENLEAELGMRLTDFIKVLKELDNNKVTIITKEETWAVMHIFVPERISVNMKDKCFVIDDSRNTTRYFFKDYGDFWTVDENEFTVNNNETKEELEKVK